MLGEDLGAETHANDVDEALPTKKRLSVNPSMHAVSTSLLQSNDSRWRSALLKLMITY